MDTLPEVFHQIAQVAGMLCNRGWAEGNAGNISVRVTGKADEILLKANTASQFPLKVVKPALANELFVCTGSGTTMMELHHIPENNIVFVLMNGDGTGYSILRMSDTPDLVPTSELSAHLAVHEALINENTGHSTLLHTHATELIAVTHLPHLKQSEALTRLILSMFPEAAMILRQGIGFIPYLQSGSEDLALATANSINKYSILIWEKHGALATGKSPSDAFDKIDIATKAARIYFMCKNAGFEPEGISDDQIKEIFCG